MSKKVKITAVVVVMLLAMCAVLAACDFTPTDPDIPLADGIYKVDGYNINDTFFEATGDIDVKVEEYWKTNYSAIFKKSIETSIENLEPMSKFRALMDDSVLSDATETQSGEIVALFEDVDIESMLAEVGPSDSEAAGEFYDLIMSKFNEICAIVGVTDVEVARTELNTKIDEYVTAGKESAVTQYATAEGQVVGTLNETAKAAVIALNITTFEQFTANLDALATAYASDTELVATQAKGIAQGVKNNLDKEAKIKIEAGKISTAEIQENNMGRLEETVVANAEEFELVNNVFMSKKNEEGEREGRVPDGLTYDPKTGKITDDYTLSHGEIEIVFYKVEGTPTFPEEKTLADGEYKAIGAYGDRIDESGIYDVYYDFSDEARVAAYEEKTESFVADIFAEGNLTVAENVFDWDNDTYTLNPDNNNFASTGFTTARFNKTTGNIEMWLNGTWVVFALQA